MNRRTAPLPLLLVLVVTSMARAQSGPEGGIPLPPADAMSAYRAPSPIGPPPGSIPPPPAAPFTAPGDQPSPPPGPSSPPPSQSYPPPGQPYAPRGAIVVPPSGQPYRSYPYAGPVAVPPGAVLVPIMPAPPLPSYRWSVSLEALWLERSVGGSVPLGYTTYNPASGSPQLLPEDSLFSDDVLFPLATGLRFQVSRRLDERTAIDATYWGLQQWSVGRAIDGDPQQWSVLAFSPWLQTPDILGGLDDTLEYRYKSEIHNVEVNQRFKLNPDDFYWTLHWLWGARYLTLSDDFTLAGLDTTGVSETLESRTVNNLMGLQTGLHLVRGWDRFQLETAGKI